MPVSAAFCLPESLVLEFLPRTYDENGAEPRKRWIKLILLAFHGTTTDDRHAIFGNRRKRRKDLQGLCHCIDFHRIQLLDDVVTEVILSLDPDAQGTKLLYKTKAQPDPDSEYASVIDCLWVQTREDPLRVRFPVFDSDSRMPTRELSETKSKEELDVHSVYRVRLHGDETLYVYKEVERPHYVPLDTEVLEQELQNLELFRGTKTNIIQLVAAIISRNPYQTTQSSPGTESIPSTLRGILLEYHPNGTLEAILESPNPKTNTRWRQWSPQIASALAKLHHHSLTHMDLKPPSNIVITNDFDAVLIDISGIGVRHAQVAVSRDAG